MTNDTMDKRSDIEKAVMQRVYRIRILRGVFSGFTASGILLLLALWGIGREVWVAKVFANGPHDFIGHLRYLGYALLHTRLIVQALSLVTLGALIYLARETARWLTHPFTSPRHAH